MENLAPRRSLKRKLEQDLIEEEEAEDLIEEEEAEDSIEDEAEDSTKEEAQRTESQHLGFRLLFNDANTKILRLVSLLNSTSSSATSFSDRAAVKSALDILTELANDEDMVDTLLNCGVVSALLRHLEAPAKGAVGGAAESHCHEVEKGCAFILSLLAVNPEHQQFIVDAGALPCLVDLLRRHKNSAVDPPLVDLLRRVADAITNIAHENTRIKNLVRLEGAIPVLVELLEFNDARVQRAAAGALRILAFKNDENKKQIVECNALPTLSLMLRSESLEIHYEAVGVIGNLVHSSPNIKRDVLLAGALQPVIGLLRSSCSETRREAALLIGQFATTDSDSKVHIAQIGAIQPLVEMLESSDVQLQEMSAFALGRLAQDPYNQAGIACNGGVVPLLNLLDSKNGSLQHNAVFALYGLAENEDNVVSIIKAGGFQKLLEGCFRAQPTRECVARTLKRLGEKIQGQVLKHLISLMRFGEKIVQRYVAIALAHLCSPRDHKTIFIDNSGLELLLHLLEYSNIKVKGDASTALHRLATKAGSVSLVDAAPSSPTPQMYLGEECINNPKHSDVTFLVEGRSFYAHRDCLLSSDIFRAMFDGGYREGEAKHIEIPNIKWDVFELMMRYIYTGTVDVDSEMAKDLLVAADQYLLDGLKRVCEYTISQEISVDNVSLMYEMSEAFNATSLKHACILFILERFDKLRAKPWYCRLFRCILPDMRKFFSILLIKSHPADS